MERMEWIDNIEQVADGLPKVGGRESLMLEYISPTKKRRKKGDKTNGEQQIEEYLLQGQLDIKRRGGRRSG